MPGIVPVRVQGCCLFDPLEGAPARDVRIVSVEVPGVAPLSSQVGVHFCYPLAPRVASVWVPEVVSISPQGGVR